MSASHDYGHSTLGGDTVARQWRNLYAGTAEHGTPAPDVEGLSGLISISHDDYGARQAETLALQEHRALVAAWQASGAGAPPTELAFKWMRHCGDLGQVSLVDVRTDPYRMRVAGTNLRDAIGRDPCGETLEACLPRTMQARLRSVQHAVRAARPAFGVQTLLTRGRAQMVHLWLVLPLAGPAEKVGWVLCHDAFRLASTVSLGRSLNAAA